MVRKKRCLHVAIGLTRAFVLLVLAQVATALVATAQVGVPQHDHDTWTREHLLGDAAGLRPWLAERGLTFELVYTAEYLHNFRGGIRSDRGDYRGDVSLYLELDTQGAGWWEGGTFFVHLQEQHGRGISERYVGDFQVLSNIDDEDFYQVSEFWYRHSWLEDRLWVKLGKMEANEDLMTTEFTGEFIHPSPGLPPDPPMVTYPDQDWGVVMAVQPLEFFSLRLGVLQGRPDGSRSIGATLDNLYGPLVIVEPAWHYELGGREGNLRVGYWYNGDRFEEIDYRKDDEALRSFGHNQGWYATWDQDVVRDDDGRGVGVFAQYATSRRDRNELRHYVGGGMEWAGPLEMREDDVLGLGLFSARFNRRAGLPESHETAIELFYKAQLTGWMSLKPIFQYVRHPGGEDHSDAYVGGARLEIAF